MRDYKVKSEVEIKFIAVMYPEVEPMIEAENEVKEMIKNAADYQFGKIIEKGTKMSVIVKCTTTDVKTGIVLHQDK